MKVNLHLEDLQLLKLVETSVSASEVLMMMTTWHRHNVDEKFA